MGQNKNEEVRRNVMKKERKVLLSQLFVIFVG